MQPEFVICGLRAARVLYPIFSKTTFLHCYFIYLLNAPISSHLYKTLISNVYFSNPALELYAQFPALYSSLHHH